MSLRKLKILWIKAGLLHPLDTGGKLRTYNMLKKLKKRHHITFLTLTASPTQAGWKEKADEYSHEVITVPLRESPRFTWGFYGEVVRNLIFSRLPYAIEKYRSRILSEKIMQLADQGFDLLVCDFLTPAVNMNGSIGTPVLLFQHNVESQIWERHYKAQKELPNRIYFWIQWKRMMTFEKQGCALFDGVVTVSPQDGKTLQSLFHLANILGDVPTGVDTNYFHPFEDNLRKKNNIVFTGSMDWLPNEDGVFYFVEEIYPKIKAVIPDVTFTIAGRNPSRKVVHLQELDSSIHVTGTVEDIRPHIASARAIIVPLRIAGGTRIKIFEGMAMGIPIVSTNIGAEGLPVIHNENILLADNPEDFSRETVSLMRNSSRAKQISRSALQMVKNRYTWDAVSNVFESYCLKLLEKHAKGKNEN